MDAAAAAAMSDPERNPHFRRRWQMEAPPASPKAPTPPADPIGAIGLALLEAWRKQREQGQPPEEAP